MPGSAFTPLTQQWCVGELKLLEGEQVGGTNQAGAHLLEVLTLQRLIIFKYFSFPLRPKELDVPWKAVVNIKEIKIACLRM